jgi:hypothetical protein
VPPYDSNCLNIAVETQPGNPPLTWRTIVSQVRLGGVEYRVIRPAEASAHILLYEGWHGTECEVDRNASIQLALAWAVAAHSPRSLVYLPAKRHLDARWRQELHDAVQDHPISGNPLDLLLGHHSLVLPASRWRSIRQRLGAGVPDTITLPPNAYDPVDITEHRATVHHEFQDFIRWDIAADTLILTGSPRAYRRETAQLRNVTVTGPGYQPRSDRDHCCAEIHIGRVRHRNTDKRRPGAQLHVIYRER